MSGAVAEPTLNPDFIDIVKYLMLHSSVYIDSNGSTKNIIVLIWLALLVSFWFVSGSIGTTHLFPTPAQVFKGLGDVWQEGLITHLGSSLSLCFQAIFYSVIISMIFAYLTTIAFSKSLGTFLSKLRYLPPTGIAFYVTIMMSDARAIQVWVLKI